MFTFIKISKLLGQAVGVGLAVALVEEVLFRAWLQEEIAVDLGFHKAVFLSAVAFALVHWWVKFSCIGKFSFLIIISLSHTHIIYIYIFANYKIGFEHVRDTEMILHVGCAGHRRQCQAFGFYRWPWQVHERR